MRVVYTNVAVPEGDLSGGVSASCHPPQPSDRGDWVTVARGGDGNYRLKWEGSPVTDRTGVAMSIRLGIWILTDPRSQMGEGL